MNLQKAGSGGEIFNFLTLFSVAVGEFSALHMQVNLMHCDLKPTEGAIGPSHQQTLSWSVLRGCWWVKNPQIEGLSPAEGSDSRHLGLHVAVRSWPV